LIAFVPYFITDAERWAHCEPVILLAKRSREGPGAAEQIAQMHASAHHRKMPRRARNFGGKIRES
jgi:hypothetical protein